MLRRKMMGVQVGLAGGHQDPPESILCLINKSLSYALISFCPMSVCRYSSSELNMKRSDIIGQGR